ncbi:Dynamin central region-domain-containing protein [Lentinula edodes]|nr:Dynamin central region-domain-containing protein [Lentinula edodes]
MPAICYISFQGLKPSTAHQNGGPPELGEDGDAAANADGNMTLDSSKSIALALEAERDFFEKPSVLTKEKHSIAGTPFLTRKLNMILMHHIRATLPDIKARISSQPQKYNVELMQLEGFMAEHNSGDVVLSVITDVHQWETTLKPLQDVHTCLHSSTGVIYR